uniref:Integrator complex subunit 10 n=1 Tax=Ditylenchus dipsaci TaxID=166011 RepID=A0A915ELU5_9BILA
MLLLNFRTGIISLISSLWKLEQLVTLNNSIGWRAMINKFATAVSDILSSNQELSELLAYDLIRVEIDVFNRRLYRTDASDFASTAANILQMTKNFTTRAIQTGNVAFVKFILPLVNFLFNNKQWKFTMDVLNDRCFKCHLTDFSRLLASYFYYLFEEKNAPVAAQIATNTFWTIMWPTFEVISTSVRRPAQMLITRDQLLDFLTLLKEATALDFFFGYTCFLFNSTLPASMEEDRPLPSTTISSFKRIFNDHELVWRQLTFDSNSLDVKFIESVIQVLCRNAVLVHPVNANWLRICGDFNFAKENWNEAVIYYLEVIAAVQRSSTTEISNMDAMYTKISIALAALKMPTLAAIVGQLRASIESHLLQVEWLLQGSHNTVDSGPAYFSLIADVNLMEHMAVAYTKLGLPVYVQNLIKSMPTKAINPNNSPQVLQREVERRKKRFLEILFNQFFKQNL